MAKGNHRKEADRMAKYRLRVESRDGGKSKKVEVSRERIRFRLGAWLICLLMAFLIWLYCTSMDIRRGAVLGEDPTGKQTACTDVTLAEESGSLCLADRSWAPGESM